MQTYSIVTTEANELMRRIHNTNFRMPVILLREEEKRWLDQRLDEREIETLLRSYPSECMDAYMIGRDSLRRKPRNPAVLRHVVIKHINSPY